MKPSVKREELQCDGAYYSSSASEGEDEDGKGSKKMARGGEAGSELALTRGGKQSAPESSSSDDDDESGGSDDKEEDRDRK